jgi:hypothetical protein
MRRSANVDLPWSIWATIEKLRIFFKGVGDFFSVMGREISPFFAIAKPLMSREALFYIIFTLKPCIALMFGVFLNFFGRQL